MVPSSLPTGTVSSGPSVRDRPSGGDDRDARARIAELERENEALRAAVERQRHENDRIVDRYEQLLERERSCGSTAERTAAEGTASESTSDPGVVDRLSRLLARL